MSKRESENMDTTGYVLPEDSQFRLKKLHEHMVFLSHLAQRRTHDGKHEWMPEIRTGELAVCLELLAEQVGLVLEQVSWPAERESDREPSYAAPDAGEMEGEAVEDEAGDRRFVFGVTLDQMDELDRLLAMITAHGDVVSSAHDADLAIGTLPLVGTRSLTMPGPRRTSSVRSRRNGSAGRPSREAVYARGGPFMVHEPREEPAKVLPG